MAEEKAAAPVTASENTGKDDAKKATKADAKDAAPKKAKKFVNPFSSSDPEQARMVNSIMKNGKKETARRILRDTFAEMDRMGSTDVLKTFRDALDNATPSMEIRPKRIGGGVYQIPIEVKPKRRNSLAVRWLLEGARNKKGMPMYRRLAQELMSTANDEGFAANRKKEVHRMAEANKAFAHLARY